MYEKETEKLLKKYNNLLGYSEEDIKNHIVGDFLIMLGYKKDWFRYEYPTYAEKRRVDISVQIERNKKNLFFVEVKKADDKLNISACTQLANYLNAENIEWGMLTNGLIYILFNNNINAPSDEKEVFRFYLKKPAEKDINYSSRRNKNSLKYFSYDYLFKKKVTNYFKYLKEFKLKSENLSSYRQYDSLLYNYFDYLSRQDLYFDIGNIRPNNFKNYLLSTISNNSNKTIKRTETIVCKYAYIRGFYSKILEKTEKHNPFKDISPDDLLKDISLENHKKENVTELLSINEINLILKSYDASSRFPLRNKIIFLLFLYCGLDISEMQKLKVKDINMENNIIAIGNRIIPLHPKLTNMIKKYLNERQSQNIKCKYLICGKYDKKYTFLKETNYHLIISKQLNDIEQIPTERKKLLTPYFIKWSLIKELFNNNVHIEDIAKFTGLSLSTIGNYISYADMDKKVKLKNIVKNHPYNNILDSLD
ncbi:MAG: type I restriction enzyme HsdR N-terminal domain-containing protein [Clostridium sp.]|nr:type I restriction enzyme HsdR N-terminal domain-containing protein [Clostridium sp.]